MKLASYFALVTSFLTSANALVGSSWSVTNVPSSGLTDITFPITMYFGQHMTGYFFAQQFSFVGLSGSSNVAYTGLQPRPDNSTGPVLHAAFSSFMPGTTTTDANCHSGADNGPGVSCSVEWNSAFTREYDFEVKTTGNRVWVGTVIDGVTGQRIHIGSFTLPAGAQGIQSSQAGFIEWFPWNGYEPPNHCAHLPYQQTEFGDPTTTHAGSVGKQSLGYEYGDCVGQVGFYTRSITGGVAEACGFVGQTGS